MSTEGIYKRLQGEDNSKYAFQYNEKPFTQQPPQDTQQMNNQQQMNLPQMQNNTIPQNNIPIMPTSPQQNANMPLQNNVFNNIPVQNPININNIPVQNSFSENDIAEKRKTQIFIHEKVNDFMTKTNSTSKDEGYLRSTILKMFNDHQNTVNFKYMEEITDNIVNVILGYGAIETFLHDDEISEIICCSFDNIWIEKKGQMIKTNIAFNSEKEFRSIIDSKILQPLSRRVDDSQPLVNARLEDGSRVNVVINPISADGATLDIRKFKKISFTIADYINFQSMVKEMGEFLKYSVKHKKNIIVSGGTGSGKTTLLNCLSAFIPENEAIVTIEDTLELQLTQSCIRRLEAREANAEGTGAVSIRNCLVNALRMRPDRIIVGECRSHEVVDMLQAMNTGHDGSLTTVHSNTPKDMVERLYTMYTLAGIGDVPEKAVKAQIASAIHIIVQARRLADGARKVTQITEVIGIGKTGVEDNNAYIQSKGLDPKFEIKNAGAADIILQDIYKYDEIKQKFIATGWIPTFWDNVMSKDTKANTAIFKGGEL